MFARWSSLSVAMASAKALRKRKALPEHDPLPTAKKHQELSFQCPVCMELAFDAMVNAACGHTVCVECTKSLDKCPLCRKHAKFVPNYMVRSAMAQDPSLEAARQKFERAMYLKSPAGRIESMHKKHPDMVVVESRFGTTEQALILEWIDSKLTNPKASKQVHPFGPDCFTLWILGCVKLYHCCTTRNLSRCMVVTVRDYTVVVASDQLTLKSKKHVKPTEDSVAEELFGSDEDEIDSD